MNPEEIKADLLRRQLAARQAALRAQDTTQPNPDGTYGQAPEGFVLNPRTGQMEDMRSANNPNIQQGGLVAAGIGAGQGLGMGGFDEAVAGISALAGGDYDYELARMRETDRRAREDNPLAYYGGFVPGAAATSLTALRALGVNPQGASLLGTSGRSAAIGAGEGAAYGALSGEGLEGRAIEAAMNAGLGAGVGAVAPAAVAGVRRVGLGVSDLVGGGVDAALGRGNQGRANRTMTETLQRSGRALDDVADDVARAAAQGQPEYRLMDALGMAGQRRTSGIVRGGGDGAEEIAQFLRQRQIDQPSRVSGFVEDAFGMRGTTAAQTQEALNQARKATNNANYSAARQGAGPVNLNSAIETIDSLTRRNPIVGESSLTNTEIGNRLARLRSQLGDSNSQLIDFDQVLDVKEDLGRVIGRIRKSGEEVPFEIAQVYGALDQALEGASDGYRAANTAAREGRQVVAAVDQGRAMSRPGARAADTVPQFQAMTPEQQAAARVGYGDQALAQIERNPAPTANVMRPFNSTKARTETGAMATDPALFDARRVRENDMWETMNRALGGSRTADNLEDVAGVGVAADLGRALRSGTTSGVGLALAGLSRAGNAATGQNEATRALIARMLLSNDPMAALGPAMRQEAGSQTRRRIAEALTRALGREMMPN